MREVRGMDERVFAAGDLVINFPAWEVRLRGEVVKLTPTEYRLLSYLAANPGKPIPARNLLVKV
jgi:DNA-binding response OmpR family regulator